MQWCGSGLAAKFPKKISQIKETAFQADFSDLHGGICKQVQRAAIYYRLEKILCNIYPTEIPLTEIHGKEPVMSMEMLQRHGFSGEEIEKLVEIQERYLRFYEK